MNKLPFSKKATLDEESINSSQVVAELRIKIHATGAMSIEGPLHDKKWCLDLLENTMDAIRNNRFNKDIVVPSKDLSLPPKGIIIP